MGSSLDPAWQNDINIMPYYLFVPKHILEECGDICETLKTKILPRSFFPLSNQTFHLLHIFAKSFHERYSSLSKVLTGRIQNKIKVIKVVMGSIPDPAWALLGLGSNFREGPWLDPDLG